MQEIFTEIIQDVLSQLFGVSIPRAGSVIVTTHAFTKMQEYRISFELLEDVFRFGEEVGEGKLMRSYPSFTIGLIYKAGKRRCGQGKTRQFVIITCWKGVRSG
jgi:hypothetical protein